MNYTQYNIENSFYTLKDKTIKILAMMIGVIWVSSLTRDVYSKGPLNILRSSKGVAPVWSSICIIISDNSCGGTFGGTPGAPG